MPRPSVRYLNRFNQKPTRAAIERILKKEPDPAAVARYFLGRVEEKVDSNPRKGFPLCGRAIRLSMAVEDPCLRARAFIVLGSVHQFLAESKDEDSIGRAKAEKTFQIAFDHAETCDRCGAPAYRARARQHLRNGERDKALVDAERSLDLAKKAGEEDSVGRSLIYRADIHYYRDNPRQALRDVQEALVKISPIYSPRFHIAALLNMTVYMAKGTQPEALRALEILPRVEQYYERIRGLAVERAKLLWVKGLLSARVGFTAKAEKHLNASWRMLVRLELPEEVAAITADMALIAHPHRRMIREAIRESVRLGLGWRKEIQERLDTLWEATKHENPFVVDDPDGEILGAIKALREAVTVQTVPIQFLGFQMPENDPAPIGF